MSRPGWQTGLTTEQRTFIELTRARAAALCGLPEYPGTLIRLSEYLAKSPDLDTPRRADATIRLAAEFRRLGLRR